MVPDASDGTIGSSSAACQPCMYVFQATREIVAMAPSPVHWEKVKMIPAVERECHGGMSLGPALSVLTRINFGAARHFTNDNNR